MRRLQPRYRDRTLSAASYWDLAQQELAALAEGPRKLMGHACEFETSMMLALRPHLSVYDLKEAHLQAIIDGMEMDLDQSRYLDYPGLRIYAESPGCPHPDDPEHRHLPARKP